MKDGTDQILMKGARLRLPTRTRSVSELFQGLGSMSSHATMFISIFSCHASVRCPFPATHLLAALDHSPRCPLPLPVPPVPPTLALLPAAPPPPLPFAVTAAPVSGPHSTTERVYSLSQHRTPEGVQATSHLDCIRPHWFISRPF